MKRTKCYLGRVLIVVFAFMITPMTSAMAQKLTIWAWANDEVIRQYDAIIEWYQEENPGVEVEVAHISGDQRQFIEQLYLAIAAGVAPDLTWLDGGPVKQLAAQGLLEDVTRVLEGINFTPGEQQEVSFNGRLYASPYHATSRGLMKRVDMLEEAGLDPDEDPLFEDLINWNQALSEISGDGDYRQIGFAPWIGNWDMRGWIWTFGGELVEETATGFRPTATMDSNLRAFEWLDDWAQRYGRTRNPVRSGPNFVNGTVASTIGSTTNAANYLRDEINFTVSPVPHPPEGRQITWGGGYAIGIPTAAQNKAEAQKLLRFFASPEVQARRWREFESLLPANWDAVLDVARELDPVYMPLLDLIGLAVPRAPMDGEWYRELRAVQDAVIAGTITPREALERVQIVMSARFDEVFGQ